MKQKQMENHWHKHSLQWNKLESPLRPCLDDLHIYNQYLKERNNVLILGVTPELTELSTNAICVDSCGERIQLLWKPRDLIKNAIQGDWVNLPFLNNQFDAVVGDGMFNMFSYPEQYFPLMQSISSVLKTDGQLITRVFVNNETCPSAAEVCQLALNGEISSFHFFKWRFVMGLLNERNQTNIPVVDILEAFDSSFPDRLFLSKKKFNGELRVSIQLMYIKTRLPYIVFQQFHS